MRSIYGIRFRAKYFWSAFLVLGVLSISIGANRLDPLVTKALLLRDRTTRLLDYDFSNGNLTVVGEEGLRTFVLDGNGNAAKDPQKIFPQEPFDGLVKLLDAPTLGNVTRLKWQASEAGQLVVSRSAVKGVPSADESVAITAQNPDAAKGFKGLLGAIEELAKVGGIASFEARFEESWIQRTLRTGAKRIVPLNDPTYLALFQDLQKFKLEVEKESEKRSIYSSGDKRAAAVLETAEVYLRIQGELYGNYVRNAHAIDEASKDGRKIQTFRPDNFDVLNLRLDAKTALPLYTDDKMANGYGQLIAKPYNIRHAPDGAGGYQKLELFLNAEEKRLIEYAVLMNPESKYGYVKLLQATALRERMSNRWALRRMMAVNGLADPGRSVTACGPELVTFRVGSPRRVSQMENYSSLWQLDHYEDFDILIPKIARSLEDAPLLDDADYIDLELTYLATFSEFPAFLVEHFGGDSTALVSRLNESQAFESETSDNLKLIEESSIRASAETLIRTTNLSADDLGEAAVGERTAWRAYEFRRAMLTQGLVAAAQALGFKTPAIQDELKKADRLVSEALSKIAAKRDEKKWRQDLAARIRAALSREKTGAFVAGRNTARYLDFEKNLLPTAAPGARAVQVTLAVEAGLKKVAALKGKTSGPFYSGDRTRAEYYTGDIASRLSYVKLGLKDPLVPVTPDHLSQLFYKKLELLADSGAPENERKAVERISRDKAVMRFMGGYFAELASQYQQQVEGGGQRGDRATSTPLAGLLVPMAQKTVQDFVKALETPPKAGEKSGVVPAQARAATIFGKNFSRRFDLPGNSEVVAESTQPRRNSISQDLLNFGAEENFYVADPKARLLSKARLQEAFALIGLSIEGAGGAWDTGFKRVQGTATQPRDRLGSSKNLPRWERWELSNLIAVERILQMQMPGATPLERTVGSALDQKILAGIIENEAYARAPILAMQNSAVATPDKDPEGRWNRFVHGTDFTPSLLRAIALQYNREIAKGNGWNIPIVRETILRHIYRANSNDAGKVEDFCEASVRNYARDPKFAGLFKSATGLREAYGSQGRTRAWDEQVAREIRSGREAFLQDVIDPISMYLFVAVALVMAWQFAPVIVGWFSAVGSTTTIGGVLAATGNAFGTMAKLSLIMATGNLAPAGALFTTQSLLMGSVYIYRLPPQLDYAFQTANSQVITKEVSLASREKLQATREELVSSRGWAKFGLVAEGAQFMFFTAPGVYRTLGFKGSKVAAKLTKGVDPALAKKVAQEPLRDLIKEHGVREGLAKYSERIAVAMKNLDRASSVKSAARETDLTEVLVERATPYFSKKEHLRAIYGYYVYHDKVAQSFHLVRTGLLKNLYNEIKKSRETLNLLQERLQEMKKTSRWAETRAYLRNLKYKYGKDAKYFHLIVAKDYDEAAMAAASGVLNGVKGGLTGEAAAGAKALKQVMTGKNAKEIQVLIEFAKLRDLEFKMAMLEKNAALLKRADSLTPELVKQYLKPLTVDDWQASQKAILDGIRRPLTLTESVAKWKRILSLGLTNPPALDAVPQRAFKEIFENFNYLAQDYKNLNPKLVVLSRGIMHGVGDLTIDKVGRENVLEPREIFEHPENYEFLVLSLDDL